MGRDYISYLQVSTEEVRIAIRDKRKKGLTETYYICTACLCREVEGEPGLEEEKISLRDVSQF